jgi:hypothetical protein
MFVLNFSTNIKIYKEFLIVVKHQQFRKNLRVKALSIGNVAPIPSQIATTVPKIKTVVATGRLKGF